MNDQELIGKVRESVYTRIQKQGYVAPVEVMMDVGVLSKESYENWRFGRVPYLERVCNVNLHKLATLMHEIRSLAVKYGYEPSVTLYKKWGKGTKITLRFSKYGNPRIEEHYSTHYLDRKRLKQMKAARKSKVEEAKKALESPALEMGKEEGNLKEDENLKGQENV